MAFVERWYQQECADAFIPFFGQSKSHPVGVVPTGGGKTIIMNGIINRYLSNFGHMDVVVLSHVGKILEQNFEALARTFGSSHVGLYSASLGMKKKRKITVAGIQSVHKIASQFKGAGLVIIDECHMINHKEQGMYRRFLSELGVTCCGLTATPYRLGHGYIHIGDEALFNSICYDLSSFENFNRLVAEGYLARLITKKTILQLDLDGVHKRGGDFDERELSIVVDRESITNSAVDEIMKFGKKYKKWLIFAIDIKHANHIAERLNHLGVKTVAVHSDMTEDQSEALEKFNRGEIRAVVNVEMLTTGYDEKEIDLIACLRPTCSPSLHVQMIGRGLRPVYAEGFNLDTIEGRNAAMDKAKPHCLVLDFANNIKRIGPINDIKIKQKGDKKDPGVAPVKECPECGVYHHGSVRVCDVCGFKFEFKEKILTKAQAEVDVVLREKSKPDQGWVVVNGVEYSIHKKQDRPDCLKVTYHAGVSVIKDYIHIDGEGYPYHRAKTWLRFHTPKGTEKPLTVASAMKMSDNFLIPKRIHVRRNGKYMEIIDYEF